MEAEERPMIQMALMVHKMMTADDKKDGLHRMIVAGGGGGDSSWQSWSSPASNRRWPMEAGDHALRPGTNAIQVSVPDVRALDIGFRPLPQTTPITREYQEGLCCKT